MINDNFIDSIRIEGEKWQYVNSANKWYAVSTFGRTCSLRRTIHQKNGSLRIYPPCLLNGEYNRDGYRMILINYNTGNRKLVSVHRLVAEAFIPNPDNLLVVDHVDRNPKNNHVSNLRWATHLQNILNSDTRKAKMKEVVCLKNGKIIKKYDYVNQVKYDEFTPMGVYECCIGKRGIHKGYQWMYLSDFLSCQNSDVKELLPKG